MTKGALKGAIINSLVAAAIAGLMASVSLPTEGGSTEPAKHKAGDINITVVRGSGNIP